MIALNRRSKVFIAKGSHDSSCEALVTDVYSGYKKALRETNELRAKVGSPRGQEPRCPTYSGWRYCPRSTTGSPYQVCFQASDY